AYTVPSLGSGTYTVTVSAPGFKQVVVQNVKVDAGVPATANVTLEVGAPSESVVIQGGGEVLQTQSANISTTLQVKQIASLPLQTRNVLDFVVFLPGTNTTGGPRGSTINGLPQSSLNITIDGINTQDNTNKTGDGFFSYISPRLDAIEEVTVSTATPGAESGGQGAVQIKFVTRGGNNEFHGSFYEYHRNPWLNSNYWFNNRDGASINKETGQVCTAANYDLDKCKAARDRVLLNQFGGRIGGPITLPKKLFGRFGFDGRNRAFFFVNYEEFRQPTQITRQRTVFNPLTQTGVFQYNVTAGGQTEVRRVDLLALAARSNCAPQGAPVVPCTATIDPTIGKLLADIRNSTTLTGSITQLTDPNLQRFTFANGSAGKRYYPTVRLDFNLTSKHRLENVYNYQYYLTTIDTLNSADQTFPGFPNFGSQLSNRFSESLTLRSTLTPKIVNEARFGFTGGTVLFFPQVNAGHFTGTAVNQLGFNLGGLTGNNSTGIAAAAGITGPTAVSAPSRRNAPVWEIVNNLTWTRGSHNLSFGGQFTQANLFLVNQTMVPTINFGVNTNDPANAMFVTANFPGAAAADVTRAAGIYAALTGRVTAINANARLDEKTGKYVYLGVGTQRGRQRELGVFAQDSWRARPSLTLNYGVRWEVQFPFTPLNGSYSTTTVADLFGVSGVGNLFKPGTLTGKRPQFIQFNEGERAYNVDYSDFAPSFGFAWSPNVRNSWLKHILGEGGQTVVRGGYSIAYNRYGLGDFSGTFNANPGATITTNRDLTIGNLVGGSLGSLPLLLRETNRLGPPAFPNTPSYPYTEVVTGDANIIDPNIRTPYSQSWTFGIQREITKNMAIEVRYVGTRHLQGWSDYNFNDVENNILENGLLNEFRLAQANLQANIAAGRGNTFRYFGPGTGTSPLPITMAYFSGTPAAQASNQALYTSTNFTSATFVNPLALYNPNVCCGNTSYAAVLHSDATRRENALRAGLPANFFLTNPDLRGGVFLTSNSGYTRYDSMQVELRRRLSQGLLVQANYVFAKGFSSSRLSFRAPRVNALGGTLTHAFKLNWVYELPFGRNKLLFGKSGGLVDRLVGGWEFDGTARIQSGNILNFGNVRLVGMTRDEFVDAYGLYFDDANRLIYNLPKDILDNTIRAFSTSATSATGYGASGPPTGRYLAPANTTSCLQVVGGDCAPQNLYVTGPMFTRFDLSAVKRVRITERVNFELRGEFLNAFNNINYFGVTGASSSATLGQITASYRDVNNTQDPGGRLVQIVARINF
ncbi:MAG: carboxypeptidase regulatory-like domain-containing protein, partial [Blastocatellia bacterium]